MLEYLLYGVLALMLLAMSGYLRVHLAIRKLDGKGDQAQEFLMLFDRFSTNPSNENDTLRKLAVSSQKFQEEMERAFRRAGDEEQKKHNLYQMFRRFRKGEVDSSRLSLARESVSRYLDIINFSQGYLGKMMLSPAAILMETIKLVSLQPLIIYYSSADADPLSEENKEASKNMKKIMTVFFTVLGMIITAIAIVGDWAAYFSTIFSLVN